VTSSDRESTVADDSLYLSTASFVQISVHLNSLLDDGIVCRRLFPRLCAAASDWKTWQMQVTSFLQDLN
jgi:hypothetical protein